MQVSPELYSKIIAMLRQNEGALNVMYTDSAAPPVITVGVGHALFTKAEAQGLPFNNVSSLPATPEEIGVGYDWLKAQPATAETRFEYRSLSLKDSDVDGLLGADLNQTFYVLSNTFARIDDFPENAKLALTDMCYNLGSFRHWPKLVAAVNACDWTTAAAESHRNGIGDARNKMTFDLFESCVQPAAPSIS
jgi:GH24 family phage-related lysozyme (muramidase)